MKPQNHSSHVTAPSPTRRNEDKEPDSSDKRRAKIVRKTSSGSDDVCEDCGKRKSEHIPCTTNDKVFWCYDNKKEISLEKAYQQFKPKDDTQRGTSENLSDKIDLLIKEFEKGDMLIPTFIFRLKKLYKQAVKKLKDVLTKDYEVSYKTCRNVFDAIDSIFGEDLI